MNGETLWGYIWLLLCSVLLAECFKDQNVAHKNPDFGFSWKKTNPEYLVRESSDPLVTIISWSGGDSQPLESGRPPPLWIPLNSQLTTEPTDCPLFSKFPPNDSLTHEGREASWARLWLCWELSYSLSCLESYMRTVLHEKPLFTTISKHNE